MLRNIDETGPSSFSSLWYRITFGTTVVFEYLVFVFSPIQNLNQKKVEYAYNFSLYFNLAVFYAKFSQFSCVNYIYFKAIQD